MKCYRGGKINGNVKPFTKAESHFANARFFEGDDAPKEIMPSTITSTSKGVMKNVIQGPKARKPTGVTSFTTKQKNMKVVTTTRLTPIVLRYIPKSR